MGETLQSTLSLNLSDCFSGYAFLTRFDSISSFVVHVEPWVCDYNVSSDLYVLDSVKSWCLHQIIHQHLACLFLYDALWDVCWGSLNQMSDSRRPATPVRTPDDVSRQYQRGEANVRAQERVARSGENVHSDVLRSVARLSRTFSEPRPTGSVLKQPVSKQRKRRPSTVHTPGFQDMISRLNIDSAEAIRVKTAERIQSLYSSESSESGEKSISELKKRQLF